MQRLSVFVGDFDLAAATAMAADAGLDEFDAVDRLDSLIAKSLVELSDTTSVSRYRLLETIREYAAEQLYRAANTERARDAHASHYLAIGRELFATLATPRDFEALEQLRIDTPNLTAGLRWSLDCDRVADVLGFFADAGWIDSGLAPFALLYEFGAIGAEAFSREGIEEMRGYQDVLCHAARRAIGDGDVERLRQVVIAGDRVESPSASLCQMRQAEAFFRADFPAAIVHGKAAVEAARQAGDLACWASMLGLLYVAEAGLGEDPDGALAHAEEAVAVARQSPATSALLNPLMMLSGALLRIDPDRAVATAEECIRLDRTYRKAWSTICVAYAATVRLETGEVEPGLVLWRDVLRQLHWSGEIFHISLQLPNLAESLAAIDPTAALELTAIAGVIGSYFVFDGLAGYPRLTQTVEELGPDVVQAARVRSETRSYDESMQYVFDSIDNLIAATTGSAKRDRTSPAAIKRRR